MSDIETGVVATEIGLEVVRRRNSLRPLFRKMRHRIRHGHLHIAIFGPGGAGKTTLGRFLSGAAPIDNDDGNYRESYGIERFRLKGDVICSLLVAPGQERRIEGRADLYQRLTSGKAAAIINVVSYGYESFSELSYTQTTIYHEVAQAVAPRQPILADFLPHYFAQRRRQEQAYLEELAQWLKTAKKKIWMITLVTKEDLWWDQQNTVRAHYETGAYNQVIQDVISARGRENFPHEYLYASLVIGRMLTNRDEVLAENVAGYDQYIQRAQQQRLLEALLSYVGK